MFTTRLIVLGAITTCVLSALTSAASASVVSAVSLSGGSNGAGFTQTTILGFDFIPSVDISVSALGVIDTIPFTGTGSGDGLATTMPVGLYRVDSQFSGTLLHRVDSPVGTGTTLIDDFRYMDIPAIELEAGQQYRLLTIYLSSGSEGTRSSFLTDVDVDPALSGFQPVGVQSNLLTDLQFSVSPSGGGVTHTSGPNFRFTVVPEPASLALVSLGLLGISRTRR